MTHAKMLLEDNHGLVAINPKFDKLITSSRTAVEKGEGTLENLLITTMYSMLLLALHHYEKSAKSVA